MPRPLSYRDLPELFVQPLPFFTSDLPGIPGQLKLEPADFMVAEIPSYLPSGSGEFIYLHLQKTGLSHEQMISHLARDFKIAHQDIGFAGMKDRHAVTTQWVSVPARCEPELGNLAVEGLRILETGRHSNKLRTGHLRGNRFDIVIRSERAQHGERWSHSGRETHGAANADGILEQATAVAARISAHGFPNYFGDQRFGRDGETLRLGLDLLAGTKTPGAIPHARRKFLLRLSLSAVQSALFNAALAQRITAAGVSTVQLGDVMQVVATGGPFVAEDVAREQARCDAHEVVITGPMYGPRMRAPTLDVLTAESELLAAVDLTYESFARYDNLTTGTRRPYLIYPSDLQILPHPAGVRVQVTLPSGVYATTLLRELCKDQLIDATLQ